MVKGIAVAIISLALVGCSTTSTQQGTTKTLVVREAVNQQKVNEPYLGSHHLTLTAVEVRPGKFQKVVYPDYGGNYKQK